MKTHFIDKSIKYDGSQLHSLFAYLNHNILGNSIVSFFGACDVSLEHMMDGEDLLQNAKICSDEMVHFIIELFDESLTTGVFAQRLLASIIQNYIFKTKNIFLRRDGDDLFWEDKKLSISIAAPSQRSIMIHFAVNTTNKGTPVKTCSLEDLKIDKTTFTKDILELFKTEFMAIKDATYKVKSTN